MKRCARISMKKGWIHVLVCLVLCQTFGSFSLSALAENESQIIYSFKNLGMPGHETETQSGWKLVGAPNAVPVIRWQPYGANIASGTASSNSSKSFDFDVPTDSFYQIQFSGYWSSGGGIADLKIDGTKIGQYDFFGGPTGNGSLKSINTVSLSQGTHRLTLTSVGKNASAAGYYMYPSQFILVTKAAHASLASVTVSAGKPQLAAGESMQLAVSGLMSDGGKADLSVADVVYSSANPAVAEVNAGGIVTAVGTGTAAIIASVTLEGVTKTGNVDIQVNEAAGRKTRSTYYTPAKVEAARQNVLKYNWAKSMKDSAVAKADQYLTLGYEKLWSMVPPQSLPRSYGVNQKLGSPITGTEINKFGNYPWVGDPLADPWKLVDPSSGYKFPTNDFGAYYRSGLDEHGLFKPELADRSLLVNTLYPEKGTNWGVDDGFGWVDENGNRWTFIAYYTHWYLWYGGGAAVQNALNGFRDAYVLTGDIKYARAGTILLDRIADIYPSLDISAFNKSLYLNSHGGTGLGKAIGSIWETSLVKDFASSYDAFFPAMEDTETVNFLKEQGLKYHLPNKNNASAIKGNIENGVLRQIYPGVKNAQIRGNNGFHQSSLAMAAVVFDTLPETKEWLDFNFQAGGFAGNKVTGGNILASLVGDVDRDGNGNEAGPGYNRLWLSTYQVVADILDGYDKYAAADLYQNVKFRKMFYSVYPLTLLERYTAQIGDSGSTGNPGLLLNKTETVKAFEKYGDPIFAQLAYFLNNNRSDGIHGDIFASDPDKVAQDIDTVIQSSGPLDLKSVNLSGYGFAALRDGTKPKFQYKVSYAFPQMTVTEQNKETKIFDTTSTLQFEADGAGDYVTFSFDVPAAYEYEIDLKPYRSTAYGKYNVKIDGQLLLSVDFYGSISEHEPLGKLQLAAGTHRITFENTGKNADSTGYKMGLMELALLDAGEQARRDSAMLHDTQRDLWMYYGRNNGHGHRDTLNLGIHAFGLDLAPDLGYPEFADSINTHRWEWMNNTISHNTVMVDQAKQQPQWVGLPQHYDGGEQVKLIDVEAPKVYPQTSMYKRTTAMIKVDDANSYTVDFFRVQGGKDHHFSFHAAEGAVSAEGLSLTSQPTGTYAGPDVAYGQRADSIGGTGYMGSGFHYLNNVERDAHPASTFSVDWAIKDTWKVLKQNEDIHLRLTMLGQVDDVALADGIPPQNKPGNPKSLRYMIAHRKGENLNSLFTSVIEPYKSTRYVESIVPAVVKSSGAIVSDNDAKAVKVTLTNGRVDYIVNALRADVGYTVDDKIEFKGFFGVYSEMGGQQTYGYVNNGTMIGKIGSPLVRGAEESYNGTLVDFTKQLSLHNELVIQSDQAIPDANELVGRTIYVNNDGSRNAAYPIKGVTDLGGSRYRLDIGDMTPVRSYVDSADFSKGFIYDLAAGAGFGIPLSHAASQPVTVASASGKQVEGWYAGDATVTLSVYGSYVPVKSTEYSLNGGTTWTAYTAPVVFDKSGTYELAYRSIDAEGHAEEVKTIVIPVDKTAPTFTVQANGKAVAGASSIEDSESLHLTLQADDAHSGAAGQTISVDGMAYIPGTAIDWAGRLGAHTVQASVYDHAGNKAEGAVSINITTSIASMLRLTAAYSAAGDLGGPLQAKLRDSLENAQHHETKGDRTQTRKALEDFLKHLEKSQNETYISERARTVLTMDANALIQRLSAL